MDRIYTKTSEQTPPSDKASPASSPKSISAQSFFNTVLQPQTISQPQLRVSLDPGSLFLFTALLGELKTQNDLALAKMKMEADQKKKELDDAEVERREDEKRFAEVRHSLYM